MEKEIFAAHEGGKCNFRIFRPGIIVGHSVTCEPDSSCGGVYGFLSLGFSMKRTVENKHPDYFNRNKIKIFAESDPALSLITVDHVVDILIQVANNPASINDIYHVTPQETTDLKNFAKTTRKLLGMNIVFTEDKTTLNVIDRSFEKATQRYKCYFLSRKDFKIKNTIAYSNIPEGKYHISNKILYRLIEKFCVSNKNKVKSRNINFQISEAI
jgi:nucleoside-diphosphate-sugar epimerase